MLSNVFVVRGGHDFADHRTVIVTLNRFYKVWMRNIQISSLKEINSKNKDNFNTSLEDRKLWLEIWGSPLVRGLWTWPQATPPRTATLCTPGRLPGRTGRPQWGTKGIVPMQICQWRCSASHEYWKRKNMRELRSDWLYLVFSPNGN